MGEALLATVLLGSLLCSAAAAQQPSPECARRYRDLIVRLPSVALTAPDQTRANAEVKSLFGLRPEVCEKGGYQEFLQGFLRYSQDAVRSKAKQRDGMLRAAMALLEVGPVHVPQEERPAAVSLFHQVRSDLASTINDVRATAMMELLMRNFERMGAPLPLPPADAPQGSAQAVRVPTVPLPPWVVVSLYEIVDLHRQQNYPVAQGKLETIMKWLESAP